MKSCAICGKRKQNGNNVSHSNMKSKRSFNVNLQSIRASVNGAAKTIRVCTNCIKSNKVQKSL